MKTKISTVALGALVLALFLSGIVLLRPCLVTAAELPLVRIAHGAFNEKVVALWVAA